MPPKSEDTPKPRRTVAKKAAKKAATKQAPTAPEPTKDEVPVEDRADLTPQPARVKRITKATLPDNQLKDAKQTTGESTHYVAFDSEGEQVHCSGSIIKLEKDLSEPDKEGKASKIALCHKGKDGEWVINMEVV